MRLGACVLGLGMLLTASATAIAQERPDFSGTWTAVSDAAATTPTGKPAPPAYGAQFTIVHQGQTLTLTRTFAGSPATIVYTLDGSETTSRMPGRLCEPDSGATWTASWDGSAVTLAMVGAMPPSGKPIKMDVKSTLRLESSDTLRVEVTARSAAQNTAPRVTSTVYRKTGPPPPAAMSPQKTRATISQVAWISGTWIGTSYSGTTTFEERWTPAAAGSMMAISRTLRDGAMSAFEFLCIVERDGGLVYVAMPNGRQPATDFTLTKIEPDTAVFENPAHDFPKMIRYAKRADGSLEATISGEGGQKPQTFVFKRQE
jgi:Domain of unknown function (DUF6265)